MANCEVPAADLDCLTRSYLRKRCVKYKSTDYEIQEGDDIIVASAAITVTLPLAFGNEGCTFTVKRLGSAGGVTVIPQGGELIDFETEWTFNIERWSEDYVSDGQNWIVV